MLAGLPVGEPERRHPTPRRPWPWVAACVLPLAVGLGIALRRAWVCDDAFISFRYVDNFSRGLGLVYNAGERVEGYTHFLWVILLAALHRTGADLVALGRLLPLVFHAGTLAALAVASYRRRGARPFLPLAAWGVALHPDMQIWASGGLETAAFTFWTILAVLVVSEAAVRPRRVAAIAALAALFRPEGVLVGAGVAAVLAWRRPGMRALSRFAGVWLAMIAPLVAWRRIYYGDWLPNTYYAKSAGLANWEHGWHYVTLYFSAYPFLLLAAAGAFTLGVARRRRADDATLASAIVSGIMLLYVVRVGGDFMFARFLVPVTPLLYLVLEESVRRRGTRTRVAVAALVVAATLLSIPWRERILADGRRTGGIADERAHYPPSFVDERRRQGEAVAAVLGDLDVGVCVPGAQASFAYFARFRYAFERYGLTDRELARRPLGKRGRPGHEREVSRRDLVARRVHLLFRGRAEDRTGAVDEIVIGDLLANLVFYDRTVMEALHGRPGVRFVDYPAYLDSIAGAAATMSEEARRSAWTFANGYYFDRNEDPERRRRVAAALAGDSAPSGR